MIDFTRRRFLFGLAAVPLIAPAVKHFVMPKFTFETGQPHAWFDHWRVLCEHLYPPEVASHLPRPDKFADALISVLTRVPDRQWHDLGQPA